MLIICPNCAKSYHIARSSLGENGRSVQCSKCLNHWICAADGSAEAGTGFDGHTATAKLPHIGDGPIINGEVVSHDTRANYDALYTKTRRVPVSEQTLPGKRRPVLLQLSAAACALALAMGSIAARQSIVAHVPGTAYFYASIGLPVNLHGISFGPVKSALATEGVNVVLSVEGTLTNERSSVMKVPQIVASLQGKDGRSIYTWTSPAPKATLAPGETAGFRTRLAAPPGNADKVVLRFARADEMTRTVEPAAGTPAR